MAMRTATEACPISMMITQTACCIGAVLMDIYAHRNQSHCVINGSGSHYQSSHSALPDLALQHAVSAAHDALGHML